MPENERIVSQELGRPNSAVANTTDWTELPEGRPGELLYLEWTTYRREVGNLLKDGNEGRYVVIKDDKILGLYESWDDAREAGLKQFLLEPFLVQCVRAKEPLLRVRGLSHPWRS